MNRFLPLGVKTSRLFTQAGFALAGLLLFLSLTTISIHAYQQTNKISAVSNPIDLEPGKSIERQLAGREIHAYRVLLANGQYVGLQLRQVGVDVACSAFDTSGKKIGEFNSQHGNTGVESVTFIADAPGYYRLDVRAAERAIQCGGYLIQLVEVRESTDRDRKLLAARSLFNEGKQQLNRTEPQSLRAAISKFKDVLEVFTAEDDRSMQFQVLLNLGRAYHYLVERNQTLICYEQALSLSRSLGDRNLEAEALASVAITRLGIFNEPRWLDVLGEALQMKKELGDILGQANILNNFASAYYALNDYQKSIDYRNQALALYRTLGYRSAEFNTLISLGTVYNGVGERQRALDYYQQAVSISKNFLNPAMEAEVLAKIGGVYYGSADYPTALKYYKQALPLSQTAKDRYTESGLFGGIGSTLLAMGQYSESRNYIIQALQIAREEGKPELEIGALRNLALVDGQLGEPDKAREYFKRELEIDRALGSLNAESLTLYVQGEFERDQGNYETALENLSQAIKLKEKFCSNIVSPGLRTTYFSKIRGMYEVYMDTLMLLHKRNPEKRYNEEALRISEMTRARSLVEILGESQVNIRAGVNGALLDTERRLQQELSAKADDLFQLQFNKADDEQINTVTKEFNELTAKYQEVENRIRTASPHYVALTRPTTLSAKEIQQQLLDDDTVLLEYMLGRKRSYVWAVTKDSIASYELTGRIGITLASQNVYSQLVARNKQVEFETVDERQDRTAKADKGFFKAAAELSRLLLAPVARHLNKKRLLIVCDSALQYIPFAALPAPETINRLPLDNEDSKAKDQNRAQTVGVFAADYRPLMADHEIINLPSASALAVLRQELVGRKPAPKMLAVFGDPIFDKTDSRLQSIISMPAQKLTIEQSQITDKRKEAQPAVLSRLPFTRKEAEAIGALVPANLKKAVMDFDANRVAAMDSSLSQYRYIHFATHAVVDSRRTELSGIALSMFNKQGFAQEGFLRLYDIFNLRLPAELVVLSGCSTGLGKELRGEGLIGLTRGFMYAGAARVMVSLWDVNDEATAEFMERFYKMMIVQKLTPAAALKATQASMAKDKRWSAPYYWAAFIIQGEPL